MYIALPSWAIIIVAIVLILLIAMMLMLYVVKSKHDADDDLSAAENKLQSLRENRYAIASDLITAFAEDTDADKRFEKLIESYPTIDSEEKEQQWEKVYVPAVKSFMRRAKNHAAPTMMKAVDLAYEQLDANERALIEAQDKLDEITRRREKMDEGIWRFASVVSDKLINSVKIGENAVKHGREVYQRAKEGSENIWDIVEGDKIDKPDMDADHKERSWRDIVSAASSEPIAFIGDNDSDNVTVAEKSSEQGASE